MSVIYKIYCLDENIKDCYIGSTTNFYKRKIDHKTRCNNNFNFKLYTFIRANGGFTNWNFEVLEKFENKISKGDLEKIEGQYIKNNNATLNSIIPTGLTKQEYNKEYKVNNKEKISERKQEYYINNKKKISERKQEYYINNKEKKKEYYEKNKQKLQEKIMCDCGSMISRNNISIHIKTKKHIKLMQSLK